MGIALRMEELQLEDFRKMRDRQTETQRESELHRSARPERAKLYSDSTIQELIQFLCLLLPAYIPYLDGQE